MSDWRHLAAIHSWRSTATVVLVAVPLFALGALMIRGSRSADVPNIKAPNGASDATLPAPPSSVSSLTALGLPGADGTTTTGRLPTTGSAAIGGTVTGPSGAVPAAIVHVERTDGLVAVDVRAGDDGRYAVSGLPGGRYRVRGWLAPALAQATPTIVFFGDGQEVPVDLTLEQFGPTAVTSATAPDPPIVGQPFNLAVRVAARSVSEDGVVRSSPVANATVALASANLVVTGPATGITSADGSITFLVTCRAIGPMGASVGVKQTAADPGANLPLQVADCSPVPTTTTAGPAPPATAAPTTTAKPPN